MPSSGQTDAEEISSVLTERAMETIRLLRRELERCQIDLQTDEELFAEKTEELSQLQSAYSRLLKEKENLENMWLAAQENEGLLQSEVFQLKEHLTAMARQLSEKENQSDRQRERDSLQSDQGEDDSLRELQPGGRLHYRSCSLVEFFVTITHTSGEVFGELESSSHQQVIGESGDVCESGEGGEDGGSVEVEGKADRLAATRSLLRGKVKTTSLEASQRGCHSS